MRRGFRATYGVVGWLGADAFRQTGDGTGTQSVHGGGDGFGPAFVRAFCCVLVKVLPEQRHSLTGDALDERGLEQSDEEQDREPEGESSAGHGEMRAEG